MRRFTDPPGRPELTEVSEQQPAGEKVAVVASKADPVVGTAAVMISEVKRNVEGQVGFPKECRRHACWKLNIEENGPMDLLFQASDVINIRSTVV